MGIQSGGWFHERSARAIADFFDLCEASSDKQRPYLSAARAGDWQPLEQRNREAGERYAREGIAAWPEVALGFYRAFVPRFVAAFIGDPDRLSEALLVLGEYQERSQALIARAYYATGLQPLELQHGEVLAASLDSVISIDTGGRVVEFNAAASKTFGFAREDAIGRVLADLIIPERFRDAHRAGLVRVTTTGETHVIGRRVELVGMRADGTELPVELSLIATTRLDGERRFTAFLRDLTEQKHAEESVALWAHTLDLAQFGVVISDVETRQVRRVNRAYARMLGYEVEELVGSDGMRLMVRAPVSVGAASADGLSTIEMWLARKDGTTFPALASTSVVEIRPGFPVRVSTVIDISERHELEQTRLASRIALEELVATLEQRVAERTAELENANRELETFSYTVSHDLRSPLRAIDGFSRALVADYADKLDDQAKHYFQRIRAGTQRMASLIDDLLKLARIGRIALRRSEIDVSVLARQVIAELQQRDPARVVDVVIADGLHANADRELVRIVLENLLGNAWKFTAKRERASIVVEGDGWTFQVRDNGAGFDMAHVDKLFVPFQRLHAVDEFEGSGIGLATVHRIIRHHGGRIWAEAELGHGATFFFTLGAKP